MLEDFIEKNNLDLPLEEFGSYDPRKPKSSDLLVSNKYIIKDKARAPEKTVWEFLMLKLLKPILTEYSDKLASPETTGFADGKLVMEFVSPVTTEYIVQKISNKEQIKIDAQDTQVVPYVLEKLGELSKIKELEGIVHNDYQLRHMLFDADSGKVYLIDVENAYLETSPAESSEETGVLREKIIAARSDAVEHFDRGYNSHPVAKKIAGKELLKLQKKYTVDLNFTARTIS